VNHVRLKSALQLFAVSLRSAAVVFCRRVLIHCCFERLRPRWPSAPFRCVQDPGLVSIRPIMRATESCKHSPKYSETRSFVTVLETLGRSAIGAIVGHCRRISAMDEVVSHGIEVDGSSTQIIVSALPVKLYSKARLESSQSPKHNHRLTCHTRQGKTTYPLAARPPSFPPPPPSALAPRAKKYKNFSRLAI
jgi:hypothetical protein